MIGRTISHYRIIEKLGEGGMGVVYKAEDTKLDRIVALKFLSTQITAEGAENERFISEAKAAAALNHPNITTIYAIEEADGQVFIAMEYIEGKELTESIGNNQSSIDNVLNYASQIAEGLQAAHTQGIVHRDIKTSNIMVTDAGQIKIMDFGLAKIAGGNQITRTGTSLGTPSYMSPEQARGETVDERTDIWSLGVVMYQMLTGELPFIGDYEAAVAYSIIHEPLKPIQELRPDTPEALQKIITRAMAKDRDERYKSARDLTAELKAIWSGQASASKDLGRPRSWRLSSRMWIGVGALCLLLFTFAALRFFRSELSTGVMPSIAVMPFSFEGDPASSWLASAVSELVNSDLMHAPSLRVLDTQQRMRIMNRLGFSGENVQKAEALRLARQVRVAAVVLGNLSKYNDHLEVSVEVLSAQNGARLGEPIRVDGDYLKPHEVAQNLASAILARLNVGETNNQSTARTAQVPLDALRHYIEGMNAAFDRQHEESIEKLLKATQLDTMFIEAFYQLAWQYGELGNGKRSMEILARIKPHISHLSEKDRLTYFREEAKYESRWRDYAGYLRKLLEIDPFDAMNHYRYGWVLAYKFRRNGAGIAIIRKSLELDSTFAEAYNRLAYIYLANGDKQLANQTIEKYADLEPGALNPLDSMAEIQLFTGLYEEAIQNCKRILAMQADFLGARDILIQVYLAQGRYAQALAEVNEYMSFAKSLRAMAGGLSLKAEIHLSRSEYQLALEAANQAIAMDSTNVEAHWRRARALVALNKVVEGKAEIAALDRALSSLGALDGKWLSYHAEGEAAVQKDDFERAIERFKQAVDLGVWDRSFYLVALAGAYQQSGQLDSAMESYTSALAFNPNNARAAVGLAQTYRQLQQFDRAEKAFGRAREIWSLADPGVKAEIIRALTTSSK